MANTTFCKYTYRDPSLPLPPYVDHLLYEANKQQAVTAVTASCQHLAYSIWPSLTALYISNNSLSAASMKQLIEADWLNLQKLDISQNNRQWCRKIHNQLVQAPWTAVQDLDLSRTPLEVSDALQLGKLGWNFSMLRLAGCFAHLADHDEVQAMHHLAAEEWLELKVLNVSENSLSAAGVAQLVKGDWRARRSLDISNQTESSSGHSARFVEELGKAQWPALQHLNLSLNHLDDQDIRSFGQLHQAQLQSLNISDCFHHTKHEIQAMQPLTGLN